MRPVFFRKSRRVSSIEDKEFMGQRSECHTDRERREGACAARRIQGFSLRVSAASREPNGAHAESRRARRGRHWGWGSSAALCLRVSCPNKECLRRDLPTLFRGSRGVAKGAEEKHAVSSMKELDEITG